MNKETLAKANKLKYEIEKIEKNLARANGCLCDDTIERETDLVVSPDFVLKVPLNLFKTINKLIQAEYRNQLANLEDEFSKL